MPHNTWQYHLPSRHRNLQYASLYPLTNLNFAQNFAIKWRKGRETRNFHHYFNYLEIDFFQAQDTDDSFSLKLVIKMLNVLRRCKHYNLLNSQHQDSYWQFIWLDMPGTVLRSWQNRIGSYLNVPGLLYQTVKNGLTVLDFIDTWCLFDSCEMLKGFYASSKNRACVDVER